MENGRVTGVRATGAEGSFDATARVVIGADGVRSLVARTVAATIEHAEPVRRAMYYGYFADLAPEEGPAAEFHFRGDELVYVFPCDASLTLLAVSIPIAEFPNWQRHHTTLFRESLRARPALAPRVARASQVGRVYGAGDIPGYIRVPYGAGWALVGDSALVMDPYSGQGIDQASTHAAFLADALHQWFAGEEPWERAMIGYRTRRNEFTEPTYRRTCNFARDLSQVVRTRLQERGVARSD
jgi:flavin-dependent dehydrogenase